MSEAKRPGLVRYVPADPVVEPDVVIDPEWRTWVVDTSDDRAILAGGPQSAEPPRSTESGPAVHE